MGVPPALGRWIRFNVVGALGMALQLALLAFLLHGLRLPLAAGTALAVEAAILHNFFWHERWTWRDRPARGVRERLERLARFHALNGVVSIAGNVFLTATFVYCLELEPVLANLFAIVICSLANFTAGDSIVFRSPALFLLPIAVAGSPAAAATEQPAAALSGWRNHIASVDARHAGGSEPFFALDRAGLRAWRDLARSGEIPMKEVPPPGIPDGKLHHWAGAVFVPRATVDQVVRRIQDGAGREAEFYEDVKAAKLLERNGERLRVFMRVYRDAGPVDATYNTEHAVEYRRLAPTRWTSRSVSTKIAELENAGTPQEREKAPGQDSGFLWALNAYWRFEQVADGVLIECESVSLSRSVPFLIRPIASPIVDRIARESLARTLRSLKAFLSR